MAGVASFGAVAVGFTAFAGSGGDRPATEITNGGKLAEQIAFLGFQLRQRIVHVWPLLLAYSNARIHAAKKRNLPPSHFDVAHPHLTQSIAFDAW